LAYDFLSTTGTAAVSIAIGAAVTWAVAWYYYKRAGDELQGEAKELRKLISMVLTAMEHQGSAKLNRDAKGNIVGFVFEYEGGGALRFGGLLESKHAPAGANGNRKE
jgi:hypothetical protein